jgi:phospholipid/cholesterol/gamma-HCH transport system substrate-binding protein
LVLVLLGALAFIGVQSLNRLQRTQIVAFFDTSNGIFTGDDVRILGVKVGSITAIEPQPDSVKITFWIDDKYRVPAEAKALIISPQLVTARAIQLTPAYTSGPAMSNGAVIPKARTAVPIEWDDLRTQLQKLTEALQPTQPGGVSTAGAFVNTAADNLRGQGANIRDAIIKLSQAVSILGDHSNDTFSTIKNLSVLVSALSDSSTLLRQLNNNLAAVTALLTDDPNEVGQAISDLHDVVADATAFLADNREPLGTAVDKLSSITTAVNDSLPDIKQTLHVAPNAFQNLTNIYQPAQAALTGALVISNFSNPISFLCGAIQAASRLGAEQAAKLCVQYLAPIIKNRQYNFPPLGENLFVGAAARPNEVTYTEDWMRPDYVPPQPATGAQTAVAPTTPPEQAPLAAEAQPTTPSAPGGAPPPAALTTDPAAGLPGMMVPAGSGS